MNRDRPPRPYRLAGSLVAALMIPAACSDAEAAWPERPAGLTPVDAAAAETVIDTIMIGTRAAGGHDGTQRTEILDPGDLETGQVLAAYDEAIGSEWEPLDSPSGSIGRGWEHGDQRFVVMVVLIEDSPLVVTVRSGEDG